MAGPPVSVTGLAPAEPDGGFKPNVRRASFGSAVSVDPRDPKNGRRANRSPLAPERILWEDAARLSGPQKLLRIRPKIFDFKPHLGLKLGQAKPKISGTVPTNRHTTIPGPISACFDDDPKLLNCEIAQPRLLNTL